MEVSVDLAELILLKICKKYQQYEQTFFLCWRFVVVPDLLGIGCVSIPFYQCEVLIKQQEMQNMQPA